MTLANAQNLIKPGMFGRVTFETDRVNGAVVVPREAVKTGKTGTTVTVVDPDGVAHVRKVQTGAQDTLGIQIVNGVQAGEQVVVLTLNPIKDGQKVKIAPIAPPPGGAGPPAGAGASPAGGAGACRSGGFARRREYRSGARRQRQLRSIAPVCHAAQQREPSP